MGKGNALYIFVRKNQAKVFSQILRALKIKFNVKVNKFAHFFHFCTKAKFVDTLKLLKYDINYNGSKCTFSELNSLSLFDLIHNCWSYI
jgi:hypothetical protein